MGLQFKNSQTQYGLIGRLLHWTSVILLVTLILIAGQFEDMLGGQEKKDLINTHSSIGLLFLLLMLTRFTWRVNNLNPIDSYEIQSWQKILAKSLHRCIYLILIIQCLAGIITIFFNGESFNIFNLVKFESLILKNVFIENIAVNLHAFISFMIYPLFAIHISAAIYHQIFGVLDD